MLSVKTFQQEIFDTCMSSSFQSDRTEEKIETLLLEYQNQKLSFVFYEPYNKLSFSFHENKLYYGASVIKLLEALFLLQESLHGKLDLEDKIPFCVYHRKPYSLYMEKRNVGEEISFKDLIYSSLSVSDNTAHEMLFEFIGVTRLNAFANHLGISLKITNADHYGFLTARDGLKILQETYRLLSIPSLESELLKQALDNDYYNSLSFADKKLLHKYGYYDMYYHDIGIYMGDTPYLIAIFTTLGNDDFFHEVQSLSEKLYDIYDFNLQEKRSYCSQVSFSFPF